MARCFSRSPNARFVTDDPAGATGGNLEIVGMNQAICGGQGTTLRKFRDRTSRDYAPDFIFKNPSFEMVQRSHDALRSAWEGANLIVMTRDPLTVALRELSIKNDNRAVTTHVTSAAARCHSSFNGAVECHQSMGVVMVSYEKLITRNLALPERLNEWFGKPVLDPEACVSVVTPNNEHYIRTITIGKVRRGR